MSLHDELVKLAHERPGLRRHLVPTLRKHGAAGRTYQAAGVTLTVVSENDAGSNHMRGYHDYNTTLEAPASATEDQVKAAAKDLVKQWGPTSGGPEWASLRGAPRQVNGVWQFTINHGYDSGD
jgi:hypothetical protein